MGLKSIYRRYLQFIINHPQNLRLRKQYIYEWFEIFTKEREAIKAGALTREEKNRIQEYWKTYYGKKIPLLWHQKYKGYSGKLDVRYFPEIFYTTKLEPKENRDCITSILSDKALIEYIYARVLNSNKGIRIPHTYGGCSFGFYYDNIRQPSTIDALEETLSKLVVECVIKPTVGESSGRGVRLLSLENGVDIISGDKIGDILITYGNDFIIQEKIIEDKDWAVLNPSSVNTVRIISYRIEGDIHVTNAMLRIGRSGSHVDNAHAGGMYVAVDKNGNLGEHAYTYGYGSRYDKHPDSGIVFSNHCIPFMEKIREAARMLHACLPNVGIVNWDFVADDKGNVVLIEANLKCGGIWAIQNAHGAGIFGDDTPQMIKMISKLHDR